jgi:hypothetical protein
MARDMAIELEPHNVVSLSLWQGLAFTERALRNLKRSPDHNLLNNSCDIDGDTAHSETYYLFAARNRDDTNWIAGGRYFDRLQRRDGQWRIALRTNAIEWSGMVPTMPLPFADAPDIHGNGAPSRSKADPSYQRPLVNRREKRDPGHR